MGTLPLHFWWLCYSAQRTMGTLPLHLWWLCWSVQCSLRFARREAGWGTISHFVLLKDYLWCPRFAPGIFNVNNLVVLWTSFSIYIKIIFPQKMACCVRHRIVRALCCCLFVIRLQDNARNDADWDHRTPWAPLLPWINLSLCMDVWLHPL